MPPTLAQIDAELRRRELIEVERQLGRASLRDFARMAWPLYQPGVELLWNWHLDAICDHLEAVHKGQIRNLLITMPPRCLKSGTCSVMFPAWLWTQDPTRKTIFTSYAADLAERDSKDTRSLIESDWYAARWSRPDRWKLMHDSNRLDYFETDRQGHRIATSPKGKSTGEGADIIVGDDLISEPESRSKAEREARKLYWTRTMQSRLNNPKTGSFVMVMQRLHVEDPAAAWLESGVDVQELRLPAEYDPKHRSRTFIDRGGEKVLFWDGDPRVEAGELLHPERLPAAEIDRLKRMMGDSAPAQLNQNPQVEGGNMFKTSWWRFYRIEGRPWMPGRPEGCDTEHPTRVIPLDYNGIPMFDYELLSLDANFRGKIENDNDPIALGALGQVGPDVFLREVVQAYVGFDETCEELLAMARRYPRALVKLVEGRANGDAIVNHLRPRLPGLELVEPGDQSKVLRARAGTPWMRAGNVWLPEGEPWVEAFVREHSEFPNGKHDDQVDMLAQALRHIGEASMGADVFAPPAR